jgi:hypothetical protein
MNPHYLEELYQRMGRPAWFWPVVWGVLLVLIIVGGSFSGYEP